MRALWTVAALLLVAGAGTGSFFAAGATDEAAKDAVEERGDAREELGEAEEAREAAEKRRADLERHVGLEVRTDTESTSFDDIKDPGEINVYDGDAIATPFGAVGIDENVVWKVISAREVKQGVRRIEDSRPPKRGAPVTLKGKNDRIIEVKLRIRNRTGRVVDPACGMTGIVGVNAIMVNDKTVTGSLEAYASEGTYREACSNGIPDGARADIVVYMGVRGDDKMLGVRNGYGSGAASGATDGSESLKLMFEKPV